MMPDMQARLALDYDGGLGGAAAALDRMPRAQARPPSFQRPQQEDPMAAGLGAMQAANRAKAGQGTPGPAAAPDSRMPAPPPAAGVPVAIDIIPGGIGYASGGLAAMDAPRARSRVRRLGATGLVNSASPGRADLVETRLRRGSYVLPADVVSGLGQGNTMAGAKLLQSSLPEAAEMAASGRIDRAMGGMAEPDDEIDVRLSGGEFLISPEQVLAIGGGDVASGASALDELVHAVRGSTRDALGRMPPPK